VGLQCFTISIQTLFTTYDGEESQTLDPNGTYYNDICDLNVNKITYSHNYINHYYLKLDNEALRF